MFTSAADLPPAGFAQVVVERGIDRYPNGLTYAIPPDLADLSPGERVMVPLGRGDKPTVGYVTGIESDPDRLGNGESAAPTRYKSILSRAPGSHRLPSELSDLARWLSAYYCTPLGMVFATMLPGAVKKDVGRVTRHFVDLPSPSSSADAGRPSDEPARSPRLSKHQRRVIEAMATLPAWERPIEMHALADRAGLKSIAPIRALIDRGLLTRTTRTAIEAGWADAAVDRFVPDALTPDQQRVIDSIGAVLPRGFSTHLIQGVTGSGKTEVYIRLIEQAVASGKTALMLVPEIALTPQTGGRLIGRFLHHRVAVLHSGLTAAQRNQQWNLVAEGHAQIVLGARSAVFAPIPDARLGLIIVDEEHDSSYKQDQLPRYHGRDVAIRRGQIAGCPVVLGSATPSLESWHNATVRGAFTLHRLPTRVPGTMMPSVKIVDFRAQMRMRRDSRHVHLIGPLLEQELRRTVDEGFQAIILLNRRGFANYVACPDHGCGWIMECDQCDAPMVMHRDLSIPAGGYLRCHHCQSEQRLPRDCPQCGRKIVNFGLGTQRVEEELGSMLPSLTVGRDIVRVDSDTMHGASSFHDVLGRFARREITVLVGTQMIAKGLDFPGVRLVGVINADTSINLPDFRASERTFQLVSQVAGRAGRGSEPGRVVVQSFQPDALPIRLAARHDYEGFAKAELAIRERNGLPPTTRLARIVVRDEDLAEAVASANALAVHLRSRAPEGVRVRGPSPCPISRIAGFHRQQVEVLASSPGTLQRLLTDARNAGLLVADARTAVDVDPVALL